MKIVNKFRKKLYTGIDELQAELDNWIDWYNNARTQSGKYCYGKAQVATFEDSLQLTKEKCKKYDFELLKDFLPKEKT